MGKKGIVVQLGVRILVGGVLLFAAFAKLQSPDLFHSFLARMQVPHAAIEYLHIIHATIELFLGLLCLVGVSVGKTLKVISLLFVV